MQIEITIINKKAIAKDYYEIVCGNSDYIVKFSFDSEWDKYTTKTARFNFTQDGVKKHIDVVFNGTECNMPVISRTSSVEVGVFAGDLQTTTPAFLRCQKSILCDNGTPEEPPEDVYNQIMEKCSEAVDVASEAKDIADQTKTETDQLNKETKRLTESITHSEAERVEAENIRQQNEEQRETLKGELETLKEEVEVVKQDLVQTEGQFAERSQQALDDFESTSGTALAGFASDRQYLIDEFNNESSQSINKLNEVIEQGEKAVADLEAGIPTVYKQIELLDGELLQENFTNTCQNGFYYTGSVGGEIKIVANDKRAGFAISSYNKDIFVIPKEGYMMLVHYLDENNIVTASAKYWANGGTIPKNQRFALQIYNLDTTKGMTDEEAKGVVTIQNEEAKTEKRRIEGAFLDGKFSTIAYSHLANESTIINTAEHYAVVGQTNGFDAIKGDVQITSDNKLVMCHDNGYTLDANGRITTINKNNCTLIRNMTFEQVVALEHAKQYEGAYVHPTGIDSLLRVCKRYGKIPYITIRDENMGVIAPILIEKLKEYALETHCIINSFTLASLATVRQFSDCVFLSQVLQENQSLSQKVVDRINEYGNVVITTFDNNGSTIEANLEMMKHAKSRGIRIFGAVYSNVENIEKLVNNGFSGVQSYVPFE